LNVIRRQGQLTDLKGFVPMVSLLSTFSHRDQTDSLRNDFMKSLDTAHPEKRGMWSELSPSLGGQAG
jgi:hypothetical protein